MILLLCLLAHARSFWLLCVFLCLAPGDEHPEQQVHRVNPGRATSKRYRTSESAGASSSAAPPPQLQKKPAKQTSAKEFWERRRRNPYAEDQEPNLINRSFWNCFQFAIYFDVIKAKKNLYVDVRSIDMDAMENDPEYFGEALQMCAQLNILRIMQFNKDFDADLVAQFYATVHLGTDAKGLWLR